MLIFRKCLIVLLLSGLFNIATFTMAFSEVIFSDDFNDNLIDVTKWMSYGGYVAEDNGVMKTVQNRTDAGGQLYSKWITIKNGDILTISRKTLIHYANQYFYGKFIISIDQHPDLSFGVYYGNYTYANGTYCSRLAIPVKSATQSRRIRPGIPREVGHLFHESGHPVGA